MCCCVFEVSRFNQLVGLFIPSIPRNVEFCGLMNASSTFLSSSFSSALISRSCYATIFSPPNRQFKTLKFPPFFPKKRAANFACFSSFSMDNSDVGPSVDTASDADTTSLPGVSTPKLMPWLIVGLGNPGKTFNGTRHNVGFEMVDTIAEAEGITVSSVSFRALFGKGFIGNVPVILAKPQTYMNASGESVSQIVSYYKIPLQQVLVIYDDMDLPFAKLRLLPKGGHGGHNGMRNIIDRFKGSRDFPRLRIGIGRPSGKLDAINYVLRSFRKEERQELDFAFQIGLKAVRILLLEGFDKSATFVNSSKPYEQLA